MKKTILSLATLLLLPRLALAHCPLCTAGAGALAIFAASMGVSTAAVGVMIGAFALALSLWLAPLVKRKFIPFQDKVLTVVLFLATVIPIMPFIREYRALYLSWGGDYGSMFHNTYMINLFLLGVIIGAIVLATAPTVSKSITRLRDDKRFPFQGVIVTLSLLALVSVLMQILL